MDIRPAYDAVPRRAVPGARRRLAPQAAGAALALLLALTACGEGEPEPTEENTPPLEEPTEEPAGETAEEDDDEPESEPAEADDEDAEPQETESEAIDVSEFSIEGQESTGFPDMLTEFPDDGDELLLGEVRVGQHEGYDRIVFEHTGDGAPGWHAEYVDEAVEPGSGFPLEVDGEAILYLSTVGLVPGNAGSDQGQLEVSNWTDEHGTVFEDVVTTFVHHGAASYYVGLDQERDFRVSVWEHENGPRLIIDVLR